MFDSYGLTRRVNGFSLPINFIINFILIGIDMWSEILYLFLYDKYNKLSILLLRPLKHKFGTLI